MTGITKIQDHCLRDFKTGLVVLLLSWLPSLDAFSLLLKPLPNADAITVSQKRVSQKRVVPGMVGKSWISNSNSNFHFHSTLQSNSHSRRDSTSRLYQYLEDPGLPAYTQQPPHAGCHFRPTHPLTESDHKGSRKRKRFFEGWYYRITLPDQNASFAFIYSIEDPFDGSDLSLCCHQIMGPNDDYLVQADKDHTKFWAWYHQQGLGCIFESPPPPLKSPHQLKHRRLKYHLQ